MAVMKDLNKLVQSPSVLLAVLAGFFLCYMLKTYSNKQSTLLSGFEQMPNPYSPEEPKVFSHSPTISESILQQPEQPAQAAPAKMHDEINALLPNGEEPKINLLNPDQIIGMKGQVKRNQTFDLRGNIPIPKQMIPFSNPVAVADDVYTRGINTLS